MKQRKSNDNMPCWLIKTVIAKIKTVIQQRNMPSCCAKSVIEFFVSLFCLALSLLGAVQTVFCSRWIKSIKYMAKQKGTSSLEFAPFDIYLKLYLFDTEFSFDVFWNSIFIYHIVHSLVTYKSI
jgi:hypothetical protein